MSKKFSQFTVKDTVADEDFINITGRTNRRISWPNFLDEVYDRIVTPFIYPTIELLKEAPLRADEDSPVYVRVEETEYRLYKITNIAPGVNDITLDNGNTATAQSEYRDIGFVVGPETSTIGALATYDNETGTLLASGPTPSAVGVNLIEFPDSASDGYFRKKSDNTLELLTGGQLKTNLSLNNVDNTSDSQKVASGPIFDALSLKADLESPSFTGNPTAPTPDAEDDSESIATTQYVQGELSDRIQSVATIADLESLTGLTDGQVIYVNEYEAGFKDGGGEFVVDSAAAEGQIITTIDGAKCVRRSDIYKAESWGAHSSRANNAPYFQAAADTVGRIDGKRGVIYKFTDQVSITDNFEFNGNKCQVEFGDGHLNLFNLLANVDFVRIRGISNTIIKGVEGGEYCYKNLYSSYANTGTIIGFPTGTAYIAKSTVIEDCNIREARVFSAGSVADETTLDCINIQAKSTDYMVRPCLILTNGHYTTVLDRLRLSVNVYEDIIKCSPGRHFTLRDSVIKKLNEAGLTPLAEIDIYEGVEGAEIYGNKFYNCQVHRKQSGGAGATTDSARDGIHDNRFYLSGFGGSSFGTLIPLYWRGAFGNIHDNQFFMRVDPGFTGSVYGILADEEVDSVEPFDQTRPSALKIHHNVFDFIGCGGTDIYAISLASGVGNDLLRDVIGNTLYGGTRFVNGTASIFGGNSWHLPASGAAQVNAQVAYGNDIPDALTTVGKTDNALREFVVPVGGVINATYANLCRSADGVNITSITGGRQGQTMTLYARNALTVIHSTSLMLRGSTNAAIPARGFMTFIKTPAGDGEWAEISRSF